MKKQILTILLMGMVVAGCNGSINHATDVEDSVYTYEAMAKIQTDLQTDANISKDYGEALIHEFKADFYRRKAHSLRDTLFNLEYKKK